MHRAHCTKFCRVVFNNKQKKRFDALPTHPSNLQTWSRRTSTSRRCAVPAASPSQCLRHLLCELSSPIASTKLVPPCPPPPAPQTTVAEALAFSAHLRLPTTVDAATRHAFVEEVRIGGSCLTC